MWQETKPPLHLWHQSELQQPRDFGDSHPGLAGRCRVQGAAGTGSGRQLCLHQQQATRCTSQTFGRPRRGQSLSALGEKIPLSTSKQGTRLAENSNPLPSPRLKPAAFPNERAKPSGLRHARGAVREGGAGFQPAQDPGQRCGAEDRPFSRPSPSLVPGTAAARPHRPRTRQRNGMGDSGGNRPTASRGRTPPGAEPCRPGSFSGCRESAAALNGRHRALSKGIWPRGLGPLGERACGTGLC